MVTWSSVKSFSGTLYKQAQVLLLSLFFFVSGLQWVAQYVYGWHCNCYDRKARAACAQSFALWQQATIESTCCDHSIIACLHHIYMVLFFTHIPFVVNRTFNATPAERLQQHLLFSTNRTFFLWRFHTARPSHPGHSTILLR